MDVTANSGLRVACDARRGPLEDSGGFIGYEEILAFLDNSAVNRALDENFQSRAKEKTVAMAVIPALLPALPRPF
ncbi:plasmid pRiA4b ORF-3 family protein [Paenarthrobacter sp. YJN-5]|uniref:plasmid pRiA4b ORF-3 family protein n=1 Tax=Paenarthrobacter sp. YJN-5 TaxID=2735316 RepID=UPI001D0C5D2F|nr:plasmid pRiA4b ORF-3 family protein [Paenarthrobacter sp. YJN-5]